MMNAQQGIVIGIFIGAAIVLVGDLFARLGKNGLRGDKPETYGQQPARDPSRTPGPPPRSGSGVPRPWRPGMNHPGPSNPTPPPTGRVDIGPRRGGRGNQSSDRLHSPIRDPYYIPAGPPAGMRVLSPKGGSAAPPLPTDKRDIDDWPLDKVAKVLLAVEPDALKKAIQKVANDETDRQVFLEPSPKEQSPKPQSMVIVPVEHPVILDKATSTYIPAILYLRSWAQKEYDAAEAHRKKAEERRDQHDRLLALAARDALGDVLRELGRVEYK